jgi:hypothetical protein
MPYARLSIGEYHCCYEYAVPKLPKECYVSVTDSVGTEMQVPFEALFHEWSDTLEEAVDIMGLEFDTSAVRKLTHFFSNFAMDAYKDSKYG